jgi:hypothetical protein
MNSNLTSHQQVIQQNNSAVSLMESGDCRGAIAALSDALKTSRQIMYQVNENPNPVMITLDQCMSQTRTSKKCAKVANGQYMYRQAVRIPLEIESSYRPIVMVSSMIIFNLALAHQLAATLSNGPKDRAILLRAAKLYEHGFNLQQSESFGSNILFTLATVNNLGLIHQQLNDDANASKCFHHLLSSLCYLVDCGETLEYEFDCFFRNASSVLSNPCPAAAA